MSARPPIADGPSWTALILCVAVAAGLTWRWHRLGWVFGAVALLLAARAFAMVLAAKSSMGGPEEALEKKRKQA